MNGLDERFLILLLLSPILLTQSIWLFIDARKKGSYAWAWGLWGLIQIPMPTLFYYLFVIRPYRKKYPKEGKK